VRKLRSTNPELKNLASFLKKEGREKKVHIWRDIAERLAKPRRKSVAVNVSRLNRFTQKNEIVLVPGKVVATGEIDHPVTVAAIAFSQRAREKINAAKGKCLSLYDLVKKDPSGSKVKIIG
jgi:large subunit ribosomal protein L18e